MKDYRSITKKIGNFIAGKGFYIVLIACIAVIGASAWALFLTNDSDEPSETVISIVTPSPTQTPVPTPKTTVEPVVKPTPAIVIPTPTPTPVPSQTPTPKASPTPAVSTGHNDGGPQSIDEIVFMKPMLTEIIKDYSDTELQYSRTMGDWRIHQGIDYTAQVGAKVQSIADGTVTEVKNDDMYGTTVVIDHGFGLVSRYSNLAAEPTVKVGDRISAGSVIGAVGTTALAETGDPPHLHFEMLLNGKYVNPNDYLK